MGSSSFRSPSFSISINVGGLKVTFFLKFILQHNGKAYFLAIFSCKSVYTQDKSPVFHQDGCLVSVLFSRSSADASFWSKAQGRIRVSPNGTQTHSFLYKIESSVKIAGKKMNVELLSILFKIPFSVIISVIYCSAAR